MYMDKTAVAVHEVCPQRGKSADNQGGDWRSGGGGCCFSGYSNTGGGRIT